MEKLFKCLPKLLVTSSFVLSAGIISAQSPMASGSHHGRMAMGPVTDTGFVSKNVMDNMMEIRLSEIGRDQASKKEIRTLAEQMITDHTQILNDLTTIAGKLGVPAPDTTTMNMPAAGGDNSAGSNFDRTWVNQMLVMHQAKVRELQMAIPQLKDPMLKASASSALPKIRLHTEMLTKLAATTK